MKCLIVVLVVTMPALARTPAGGLKEKVGQAGTEVVTTVAAGLVEIVQSGEAKDLVVEILRGADLSFTDEKNRTLIHIAAQAGRADMIEILQRHGVDGQTEDNDGATASKLAEDAGHLQVVELLTTEQEIAEEELLSLIDAVSAGDREAVERIIAETDNIDGVDDLGRTALHHAIIRDNLELAELLVDSDASLNVKDNQGRTPADYAEFMARQELAHLLKAEEQKCAEMDEARMARVAEALALRQKNKTCRRH